MKYTCSIAMVPSIELIELAKTAEDVGFDSIALPDSLFRRSSRRTTRTPRRFADVERRHPWVDPLIAAARWAR